MYILQCPGGFPVPAKEGKFEVIGLCATVNDATAESQFALVDDADIKPGDKAGKILSTLSNKKNVFVNLKGLANIDTILSYEFSEPIKTRYGLSVLAINTLAGSVCVYVR